MIDAILRDLRQPEYIHVLINPLPVYGLAMGLIALIVAFFLKSRPAQIVALIVVFICSASAWPVYEFGEQAYDRVLSMTDDPGHAWLDEHQDRAEDLIWFFYGFAAMSARALVAARNWPRSATAPVDAGDVLHGGPPLVRRETWDAGRKNPNPRHHHRS